MGIEIKVTIAIGAFLAPANTKKRNTRDAVGIDFITENIGAITIFALGSVPAIVPKTRAETKEIAKPMNVLRIE